LNLQVAARHVQAHGVAEDVAVRRLIDRRCLLPPLPMATTSSAFVVAGCWSAAGTAWQPVVAVAPAGTTEAASFGLQKKKWRLAVRVETHLARMRGVVAADAVDTAHGEQLVGNAGDGQADDGRGREDKGHEGSCRARRHRVGQMKKKKGTGSAGGLGVFEEGFAQDAHGLLHGTV
jgi:hypothetical protein